MQSGTPFETTAFGGYWIPALAPRAKPGSLGRNDSCGYTPQLSCPRRRASSNPPAMQSGTPFETTAFGDDWIPALAPRAKPGSLGRNDSCGYTPQLSCPRRRASSNHRPCNLEHRSKQQRSVMTGFRLSLPGPSPGRSAGMTAACDQNRTFAPARNRLALNDTLPVGTSAQLRPQLKLPRST